MNRKNSITRKVLHQIVEEGLQHIDETNFFRNRGLSEKFIKKYMLGYLPDGLLKYKNFIDEVPDVLSCYKYLIPDVDSAGEINYLLFRIDTNTMSNILPFEIDSTYRLGDFQGKIWNGKTLYPNDYDVVFITESWTDALSIIQCGAPAIALHRITHILDLWKRLQVISKKTRKYILACDGDYYGKKANHNLVKMFSSLGINFEMFVDFPNSIKDCNEWFMFDKSAFERVIYSYMRVHDENNRGNI